MVLALYWRRPPLGRLPPAGAVKQKKKKTLRPISRRRFPPARILPAPFETLLTASLREVYFAGRGVFREIISRETAVYIPSVPPSQAIHWLENIVPIRPLIFFTVPSACPPLNPIWFVDLFRRKLSLPELAHVIALFPGKSPTAPKPFRKNLF